ncbi:MAG: hypothetical protein A3H98_01100 [Bacteroidetes bacterium RIFCSPLOWO2_02_FULL_36_8]|nr:MAG: hypothetical protein A3H98_01100 [Bacteroidetes bacterium RIFCSPLOWO2_02_FULL_36_8]OFY68864.1 MAG: hypothetical protein A3G23_03500 [Bacteroidetes bacterium RIFCSPLOWO2_12_FULL_37_12]
MNKFIQTNLISHKKVALLFLVFSFVKVNAQTIYYSVTNGKIVQWENNSSWTTGSYGSGFNTGNYPKAGDIAYIKGCEMEIRNQNAGCAQVFLEATNSQETKFELQAGKTMSISGNLSAVANATSKKIHIHVQDANCTLNIGGNVIARKTGGTSQKIEFLFEKNSTTTVAGDFNSYYESGKNNISVEIKNTAKVTISGNLLMDYSGGVERIDVSVSNQGLLQVVGNIQYIATNQGKTKITLRDDGSVLKIGGNFIRGDAGKGQNYGVLNCLNKSTVRFNGNTQQLVGENAGAGTDFFYYKNVVIESTSPVSPQLLLEKNEGGGATINGTITFNSGVLKLGSQPLIITANGSIAGGNSNSYINATTFNGGVVRKNYTGNFSQLFPVGDNNDYTPLTFARNSGNSNGTYITISVTDDLHPNFLNTDNVISRYWRINSGGVTTINYSLTYNYTDADVTGSEASMYAVRWDGTSWGEFGLADANNNRLNINSLTSIPMNHDFTGAASSALPLDLLSFSGKQDGAGTLLEWETSSSINGKSFHVEYSKDLKKFIELGFVNEGEIAGEKQKYSYADFSKKTPGVYYYRLNQVDINGETKLSNVIAIPVRNESDEFTVSANYPNPVNKSDRYTRINVTLPAEGEVRILIYDRKGQLWRSATRVLPAGETILELETSNLPEGTYLYTLNYEFKTLTRKFYRLSKPIKEEWEKKGDGYLSGTTGK